MREVALLPHHKILWAISNLQMMDATALWEHAYERDHYGSLRNARMREEAATLNIIRRLVLASREYPSFSAGAIFHSHELESYSGGDLEMSIRLPGGWINLALQAKILVPTGQGKDHWRYQRWNAEQNEKLIEWCDQASLGYPLQPGMLLYNQRHPDFGNSRIAGTLKSCRLATRSGYAEKWTGVICPGQNSRRNFRGSPAGIVLDLDVGHMKNLVSPRPVDISDALIPLEHLAHVNVLEHWIWDLPIRSNENSYDFQVKDVYEITPRELDYDYPESFPTVHPYGPEWAERLLSEPRGRTIAYPSQARNESDFYPKEGRGEAGVYSREFEMDAERDVPFRPIASVVLDLSDFEAAELRPLG